MLKNVDYSHSPRSASTDGIKPSRPNLLPPMLTIDSDDIDCISPALKRAFSASYLYEITSPSTTPPALSGEIECPLPRKSFPDITVLNDRRIPLSLSMSSLNLSLNRIHGVHGNDRAELTPARGLGNHEMNRGRSRGMFFLEQDDADSDCDELEAFRTSDPNSLSLKRTPSTASHKRIPSVKVNNLLRNPSLPLFVRMQDLPSTSDEPKTEPSSPQDGETSPLAEARAEFLEIVKSPPPLDYNSLVSPVTEQTLACWVEEQSQRNIIT